MGRLSRLTRSINRKSTAGNSDTTISTVSAPVRETNSTLEGQQTKMNSNEASPKKTEKLLPRNNVQVMVARTRWLALKTIDYTDNEGVRRKWDIATRTTKQQGVPDAVVIVPILRSKINNTLETLIVEQYRPPIASYSMEFPAGLVDKNEAPENTAVRELWEETGYVGVVDTTFPREQLCMSPGLSDETINIIVVNVDLDDPQNANPKQHTDEGEFINVKRVPLSVGFKQVLGTSSSVPISMLYSFAVGLELGAQLLQK